MKEKKLSERISERMHSQQDSGRIQKYLAIFLSLKEEIQEGAEAGWKVKAIWNQLHYEKKFNGTYECFLSYFNKIIKPVLSLEDDTKKPENTEVATTCPVQQQATKSAAKSADDAGIRTFKHPNTFDIIKLMGEE